MYEGLIKELTEETEIVESNITKNLLIDAINAIINLNLIEKNIRKKEEGKIWAMFAQGAVSDGTPASTAVSVADDLLEEYTKRYRL